MRGILRKVASDLLYLRVYCNYSNNGKHDDYNNATHAQGRGPQLLRKVAGDVYLQARAPCSQPHGDAHRRTRALRR